MKRHALLLAAVSCLVMTLVASAGGSSDLSWNVIASGGGHAETKTMVLDGTIGQALSGVATLGLCTGYWCLDTPFKLSLSYLPLVLH